MKRGDWRKKCTTTTDRLSLSEDLRAKIMSCRDTIHLICWYLEGRLSQAVETEIRHHLENCSDCHLVLNAAVNTLDRYFTTERTPALAPVIQAA